MSGGGSEWRGERVKEEGRGGGKRGVLRGEREVSERCVRDECYRSESLKKEGV